ncbi:hypothetical protein BBOR36S_05148 [Brevibacillus borstelensis]
MQFDWHLPGLTLYASLKESLYIVHHGKITRRSLLQNAFNFTFMERISQYIKICKKSTLQKGHPKRMASKLFVTDNTVSPTTNNRNGFLNCFHY